MNLATSPVEVLISDVRRAFETETTIDRVLGGTKEALQRFLANPHSLDQIKESLARVLGIPTIPTAPRKKGSGYCD